jgi:hypothetical protein
MEQHPVPRNISGFQFHLIGDMTLQQFIYLAAGGGMALLFYKTLPFPDIIKYVLMGCVGFVGFAFAFLPIQERPLDRWVLAFIRSIFAPTQYLWQKNNLPPDILLHPAVIHTKVMPVAHIEAHRDANQKLKAYLASLPPSTHDTINTAETNYINKTLSLFGTSSAVVANTSLNQRASASIHTNIPAHETIQTATKQPEISQPALQPISQIPFIPLKEEKPVEKIPPVVSPETTLPKETLPSAQINNLSPAAPKITPPEDKSKLEYNALQEQLNQLAAEKASLAKELEKLKSQAQEIKSASTVKPVMTGDQTEPTIKYVTPKAAVDEVGLLNITKAPNIVIGVVKDPQRKILPNIIITIKDKNGMPLRALKTNKLGQFASATPLPNGVYHLEVEDPLKRYFFDIAEINLEGKLFPPIEIVTKGEKEIIREKLSKELFGNSTPS